MTPRTVRPNRSRKIVAAVAAFLVLGGAAVAFKMRVEGGAAGGGDPDRDLMRAELLQLTSAESAFVRSNGRYAASVSELGTPVTSKVVVFATAQDGYHIRVARPTTKVLCEASEGRFAAGHAGFQLICGERAPDDRLVPVVPRVSMIDRIRAYFHEDCDADCRVEKLREKMHSPAEKQLDKALEQL